jgi:hypothetical protein
MTGTSMMKTPPTEIAVCSLLVEVLVMPNGEVLCLGEKIGNVAMLGKYLTPRRLPDGQTRAPWDRPFRS